MLDNSHIFHAHHVAIGTRIDNELLHIVHHVERAAHMNGSLILRSCLRAGRDIEALGHQGRGQNRLPNAIMCQLAGVDIHADLLLLTAINAQSSHAFDVAQTRFQVVHITI